MLSALVVARNEEGQMADCLSHLSFADEIIVVVDRSTDRTQEIAAAYGAKIVSGAWEVEGLRRQAGADACQGPWIVEVDADERVSASLAQEITAVVQSASADFFRIPFDNYIGNRLVRYGWGASFGVSAKLVLFRKGAKRWGNQHVHPRVTMVGANGGVLKNPMAHYVDRNVAEVLQRLDRYSTLNAIDLAAGLGRKGTYGKNVARIFGRFWKCYVLRKGYREGALGLLIAVCAGLYPFLSYLKAEEATAAQAVSAADKITAG